MPKTLHKAELKEFEIKPVVNNATFDTIVLKSTWAKDAKGKEYPVTLSEANIPVVMRVGCGYNVFDEYASVNSLKEQVLDTQQLIQAQRMARIYYDQYDSASVVERSILKKPISIGSCIDRQTIKEVQI